jgi:hypothetical protein
MVKGQTHSPPKTRAEKCHTWFPDSACPLSPSFSTFPRIFTHMDLVPCQRREWQGVQGRNCIFGDILYVVCHQGCRYPPWTAEPNVGSDSSHFTELLPLPTPQKREQTLKTKESVMKSWKTGCQLNSETWDPPKVDLQTTEWLRGSHKHTVSIFSRLQSGIT